MQQATAKKTNKKEAKKIKTEKGAKTHSKLQNIFLIFIIIVLTASIVFGSILLFNIGGIKPLLLKKISKMPLIGNIIKPAVENKTPEEIEMEKLQAQKNDIAIQMKQLEENQRALDEREMAISQKEEMLEQKEQEINSKLELLNDNLNSIREQVEYFENMNPANAVKIISNMESKGTVVQILRNMSKEKSSAILTLMDPLQAAQLLEDISKPE